MPLARRRSYARFEQSSFTISHDSKRKDLASEAAAVLAPADAKEVGPRLDRAQRRWAARGAAHRRAAGLGGGGGLQGQRKPAPALPGGDGTLAGVAFGIGERARSMARPELLLGLLAGVLPPGLYHLATGIEDAELAAVAWGLGAYRFRRYKTGSARRAARPPAEGAARHGLGARAGDRRGGLAGARPDQHAGRRSGAAGAGGRGPAARQAARRRHHQHRRRRPAGAEFPHDPRRRAGQQPRRRA